MDRSADAKFEQGDLVSKPHGISALMCWNKRPVDRACLRGGPVFLVPTDAGKRPKMSGYFSLSE